MKAFAASLLALAAGAKAEADPQLLLGSHLTYVHHVAAPLAYVRPISYANDAVKSEDYAAKGEYVAANAGAVHIAKREAEAEPWLSYAGVAYPGVPVTGTVYGAYPGAYRRFAIGKREAEAEADPALLYGAGVYGAGVYGAGVYGAYPYAHHAAYPYGLVRPISYANDAVKPEDYASKGQYVAVAPGAVHVAKREAEAEPWLTYAHAPLAYGYGVAPYAAYGHVAAVHPVGSYSNDAVKATPAYAGKGQYVAVSAGAVHVA